MCILKIAVLQGDDRWEEHRGLPAGLNKSCESLVQGVVVLPVSRWQAPRFALVFADQAALRCRLVKAALC